MEVEKTNLCFLSVVKTKERAKSSSQPLLHFFSYTIREWPIKVQRFFQTAEMEAKQEKYSYRTKLIFIEHFL